VIQEAVIRVGGSSPSLSTTNKESEMLVWEVRILVATDDIRKDVGYVKL